VADASDDLETGRLAAQRGRILLHEGRLSPAEVELRTARMIFMRLGAAIDLQRVDEAQKRVSAPQPQNHGALSGVKTRVGQGA
jgi:hypothetical protein